MKIIVTGGEGFIGDWLCNKLAEEGNKVISIDNNIRGGGATATENEAIERVNIDLKNYKETLEIINTNLDVDVIYHLAAYNGTQNFYNKPFEVITNSSLPIINICCALAEKNIKPLIIYTSSSEVYARGVSIGINKVPTNENAEIVIGQPQEVRWSYGISKAHGEYVLVAAEKQNGIKYVIARVHNIYGPRMGFNHFIPDVIQRFKKGDFDLPGAEETRTFCFITDCIEALSKMKDMANKQLNNTYHIGGEEEVKIKEVARYIAEELNIDPSKIINKESWGGSVNRRAPDLKKIKEEIKDWSININLKDGIKSMVRWYTDERIEKEKGFR